MSDIVKDFYKEFNSERDALITTRALFDVWVEILKRPRLHQKLDDMEEIIASKAKEEWGSETLSEFFRKESKALIVNPIKNKKAILISEQDREGLVS